jgi:hypothetical protein
VPLSAPPASFAVDEPLARLARQRAVFERGSMRGAEEKIAQKPTDISGR